ncbi:DNA polymerase IV [Occultella glacieicola]|uniref:DNA polymerase IV n=1 Tax=Occultella glacieicola TaxID=2518684 RepID=A0ABY2E183_9MICO|nr:DNA polymerase IV [Occultella glacieicola]TDE90808.1 DNA polymerase IV [Occultella glacieicola]
MSRGPRDAAANRDWGGDDSSAPILHVDMDAFFAAVELIDRPELRGRPVIVGGQHRGVVLSATYEARASGVHSAMPMAQARALCPQAVVIAPEHGRYREVSQAVMRILGEVTPVIEPLSIDEAFLDVSGARRRIGPPRLIAEQIRERIRSELEVVASVGIASTKFVAKLASSHAKPDGLLLIPHEASVSFLHSLPVGALWGVGERTQANLARLAIHTVADLAHTPPATLNRLLGNSAGQRLYDLAWGRDPRPVQPVRQEKSIGHEQTFATNLSGRAEMAAVLLDQAHRCAARLRAGDLVTAGVSIKVRFADFTTLTRSRGLEAPTDVAHELYQAARSLLAGVDIPPGGVRLLGVRCDALSDSATTVVQARLDDPGEERREAERAMDAVRARYGVNALTAGSLLSVPATANRSGDLN